MMVSVAAAAAMTSCQRENLEPEVQHQETIEVKVSLGQQTKGFTDLEGITWEVGDQIKYAGGVELVSEPLAAEQISEDGYTASFTFPAVLNEMDRTGWFVSTKCHPGNFNEVEFTLGQGSGNIFTQEAAGKMNSRYLFLHSGTGIVSIKKNEQPEVAMDIAGTIFRILPYTETYNDEAVQAVILSSNTKFVGTVAYDRGGGTYKGVNDINWQSFSTLEVNLGSPMSLDGVTSAEKSAGVYMAVAATKPGEDLQGYKYTVMTDKAIYTFDAMDKSLAVGENVVKNILLNLDKATSRLDASSTRGELRYLGDLQPQYNVSNNAGTYGLSYWYAQIKDNGSETWTTRENKPGTAQFYNNVSFEVIDDATGTEATWCTVAYRNGDTWWDVTVQDNTSSEVRSATITATFTDVDGYVLVDGSKNKTVRVFQEAYNENHTVEFWGGLGAEFIHDYTAQNDWGLSYWVINVDSVTATDWANDSHNEQALYGGAEFKCYDYTNGVRGAEIDWVTVEYKQENGKVIDTWWLADIQENTTGAVRKAEIVCTFPDLEGYTYKNGQNVRTTVITQNPSTPEGGDQGGSEEVVEGLSYTIFNNAADGSKGTGFGPGAGSVGDWYRFENITIDGKKYMPGQDMKDLAADPVLVGRLMSQAFEFGEITEDDVQIPGTDPLTANPEEFVTLEPWSDGGAAIYVRLVLSANDTGVRRTFKIITKDGEGNKVSSVVYFQN